MEDFKFGDRVWVMLSPKGVPDQAPVPEDLVEALVLGVHRWEIEAGDNVVAGEGVARCRILLARVEDNTGVAFRAWPERVFRTMADAMEWARADIKSRIDALQTLDKIWMNGEWTKLPSPPPSDVNPLAWKG